MNIIKEVAEWTEQSKVRLLEIIIRVPIKENFEVRLKKNEWGKGLNLCLFLV